MPIQYLAGKPYPRAIDPVPPVVFPNGTQPLSVCYPRVVYFDGQGYAALLPGADFIALQVLFFGCDYPIKVGAVQEFGVDTYFADSTPGTPLKNPIIDPSYPISTAGPIGGAVGIAPNIVTSATPVGYQQILRDTTNTNGLRVSGFPYLVPVPGRGLFATDAGSAGDRAPFALSLDVTLNSGTNIGPGSFVEVVYPDPPTACRVPVILWEPDFTQAVVDAGYQITGTTLFGLDAVLDVVGLWGADGYAPVQRLGAKAFSAEPDAVDAAPAPSFSAALADLRKRMFSK